MKIDVGCGKRKKEGFIGVDRLKFDGVDVVCDVGKDAWPWTDGVVEEINCSHVVEHLTGEQRIHFANEACRVLKKGGRCTIIVPHWDSPRAYGDLTHQWPPVSEFWFPYLDAEWRKDNAPHEDRYTCDFACTQPGYSPNPSIHIQLRSEEARMFALQFYRGSADDMVATLVKK